MSYYTTELRTIIESENELEEHLEYSEIEAFLNQKANAFLPTYPIFDENYRLTLNKLILKHFWMREIGFETPGRWKLAFDEVMNRWMPYYNTLYLANKDLENYINDNGLKDSVENRRYNKHDNGLENLDSKTKENRTSTFDKNTHGLSNTITDVNREQTSDKQSTSENHTVNIGMNNDESLSGRVEHQLYSDTPQGGIEGVEGTVQTETVDGLYYLTNVTKNYGDENSKSKSQSEQNSHGDSTAKDSGTSTDKERNKTESNTVNTDSSNDTSENKGTRKDQRNYNNVEEYVENIKAYKQFPAKNLDDIINDLHNVDDLVIKRLEPLFLGIWGENDSSVTHPYLVGGWW